MPLRPTRAALALAACFSLAGSSPAGDALELELESVRSCEALPAGYETAARFQDPRLRKPQLSPNQAWKIWRGEDATAYWLFLAPAQAIGEARRLGRNGYQPSWSPDSSRVLYTAMDWPAGERGLWVYEMGAPAARRVFRSRGELGPLAAWWPDGSKVVFCYQRDLWIMNADGVGLRMLGLGRALGRPLGEIAAYAFSPDRRSLGLEERGSRGCLLIKLRSGRP